MTQINGLRLAYRGLLAGLAGGYVWLAAAMVLSLPAGDPLEPARLVSSALPFTAPLEVGGTLVIVLALVLVVAAATGLAFAYFVARYFTVRWTLALAAPCVALLAWFIAADRIAAAAGLEPTETAARGAMLGAALVYGGVLALAVPTRPEVARRSEERSEPQPAAGSPRPAGSSSPITTSSGW